VLDVGAGDGWLARQIAQQRPDIHIEGIDILVRRDAYIPVSAFDGETIPHPDRSFDAVLFVDVLHHTLKPAGLVREALRVSNRQVVIKDHTCESSLDALTLKLMDRVANQRYSVALPFNYMSRAQWLVLFEQVGGCVDRWIDRLGLYPLPARWIFERSLHFIAVLKPET
jgi:ubiquinone/menaquinone biosynthesis C-methylase UbiE